MQAGCKTLLNQSGMTHISLVLLFTYVNGNSKRRTDELDPHTMYIFPSVARTTAMPYYALPSEVHWCSEPSRRCIDSMNQPKYPQGESQCSLFMGKWKIHLFKNSKLEAIFIAGAATRGRHCHTL